MKTLIFHTYHLSTRYSSVRISFMCNSMYYCQCNILALLFLYSIYFIILFTETMNTKFLCMYMLLNFTLLTYLSRKCIIKNYIFSLIFIGRHIAPYSEFLEFFCSSSENFFFYYLPNAVKSGEIC